MSVDFKGSHYPKSVILYAVFFYVCCVVSHRDLEEIMTERGVSVDHPTPNRWVVKYSPQITRNAQRKLPTANSWWMDETYVKVRGRWMYLYHAVDRTGQTIDFMHSARRNREATKRFLKRAIEANPAPNRIAIDKSGANHAGIQAINNVRKLQASCHQIHPFQSKYLNNIVEQDHRFIKRIVRPTLGFKAFHSAAATLAGIETAHMIRRQQIQSKHVSPSKQFAALAA